MYEMSPESSFQVETTVVDRKYEVLGQQNNMGSINKAVLKNKRHWTKYSLSLYSVTLSCT